MVTRRLSAPIPAPAAIVCFCATFLAAGANAQPPVAGPISDPWRTLETAHFRVHFVPAAESFARAVTARVEAVRTEVAGLVGTFPDKRVDVVIGGRVAVAAARGLPFVEGPRILLHATPPESARLEAFDDWIRLSLGHELAHIAHLSQPPEHKVLAFLSRTLPVASLILYLPPWVGDAYAAAIADRLACAGEPRRPLAAALLRQMAAERRLPALARLDGSEGVPAWPRVTQREVVGAAFLDWLDARDRRPNGALSAVWRRMTAAAPRTFRGSVARTFGAPIDELYGEWKRELEVRFQEDAGVVRGAGIDAVSVPDVASDGALVVTLRRPDGRPRLAVRERGGELRRWLDLDVAPSGEPRWLPDGTVLFVRGVADREQEKRGDLFRWWPESERIERLTIGADLQAVDPADDGRWAVALQNRWGATAVVRVRLDGEPPIGAEGIEPLVAASAETVLDAPRVAPDGRRLAYLRHRGAGWRLVVRELASGAERELGDPALKVLAWPAWSPDGEWIVVTVADGDSVRLEAWSAGEEPRAGGAERTGRRRLSDPGVVALAGAFAPGDPGELQGSSETAPEPTLLHLELSAEHGVRLVRQPWRAPAIAVIAPSISPSILDVPGERSRRAPPTPCPTVPVASGESRPYGRGPTTYSALFGGAFSPSANNLVTGWRGGDVIGRWEGMAVISASPSGAESGGLLSATWRGWRFPVQFHAYSVERRPSEQPEKVPGLGERLDVIERAFALVSGWRQAEEHRTLELDFAVLAHKLFFRDADTLKRYALQLRGDADWAVELPAARLRVGTSLLGASGWTDSQPWRRYGGELRGGVSTAIVRRLFSLDASWSALVAEDARQVQDRLVLGGTASSLIPERLDLGRIYESALPAGTKIGDRWESQRLTASHEGTRLRLFWARHRMDEEGAGRGDWLRLAGVEMAADRDSRPLFRVPSRVVRVGVAYVFDRPFRHDWMYWAGLAWSL